MVYHEFGQLFSIDEDYLVVDSRRIIVGIFREACRGNENPFLRPLPLQSTCEFLNLGPPNVVFPAFCLDIDSIETQPVLMNRQLDGAPLKEGPGSILADLSQALTTI
jgi:hypothetical protein